ncbi:MAG: nucleotidyltransferase [Bacteroidetes bacterium GWF2_40_14]|nr:MAG: nucleotidyltransferase [Bacteroidetes bacterium GWF2_40_14]
MNNFKEYTIQKQASCLVALKKLNQEKSNQTLFVLDENERLVGTVTDGDIRRGLIKGLNLESEIDQFCQPNFSFINGNINVSTIHCLKKDGIKVLPRLNEFGQIEKVYDLSRLNSILPLHAVIMAGGKGERLRPLTEKTPKPMLLLGGKPIIEHNIDRLISFGIETITISVHYLADQIINYFGDGSTKGITINYIEEDVPLGTIGCLSLIKDTNQQVILVLNSDVFTNIDFEDFYLTFENVNADMAVASIPYSVDIPYAIMELEDNNIRSFKEKPKNTYYANAGIYLIKKERIALIPKNTFYNSTDLMDNIIANKGKLIHSPITGYWIDIGKHDDYIKAKEIIRHL